MKKALLLGILTTCFATQSFASVDEKPPVTMPLAIKVVDEVLSLPKPKTSWDNWVFNTSKMTAMRCLGKKRLSELSNREGYSSLVNWTYSSNSFTFEKDIEGVCTAIAKNGISPVCERHGRFLSDSVVKSGLLEKARFDSINLTSMDDKLSSRQGVMCAITKDINKEQFYSGRTSFKWISKPLKSVENPTLLGELSFLDVVEGDGSLLKLPLKVIVLTAN